MLTLALFSCATIILGIFIIITRPHQAVLRVTLIGVYSLTLIHSGYALIALKEHGISDNMGLQLSLAIFLFICFYVIAIPNPHTMTFEHILTQRLIDHEKVMAKTALAQAHLTMVSLGVDQGHLPTTVEPRRYHPTGEQ